MTTASAAPVTGDTTRAQSLSRGAVGIALLPIERAHLGEADWQAVHTALAQATRMDLIGGEQASLFLGAPAVAFALHAAADGSGRYSGALRTLEAKVTATTRQRLTRAHRRIDRGERPKAAEFDIFYGLTGLGAYLLRRDPHGEALHEVLAYLVRLTEPLPDDREELPGWWSPVGPTTTSSQEFTGGHANLGMAHGISSVLALLSLAMLRGVTVGGHTEAIDRICAWLDTWRQETPSGVWWPQWITLAEHRTRTVTQPGPPRPSWCYGTPGLARAQQLAALALRDTARQHLAEHALLECLSDPHQLDKITDPGLCHGAAGLLHTVQRVAHDAQTDGFHSRLPHLRALLHAQQPASDSGLLDGATGIALALAATHTGGVPASGWDACLLLS